MFCLIKQLCLTFIPAFYIHPLVHISGTHSMFARTPAVSSKDTPVLIGGPVLPPEREQVLLAQSSDPAIINLARRKKARKVVKIADSDSDSTLAASDEKNACSVDSPAELTQADPEVIASQPAANLGLARWDIEFSDLLEWLQRHTQFSLGTLVAYRSQGYDA